MNGRIGKHLIAIVFVVHHCCRRDLTDPRMRHKAKSEMKLARVAGSASRAEILCGSGEVASELTSVPATSGYKVGTPEQSGPMRGGHGTRLDWRRLGTRRLAKSV